jgi:eukaryotic-like serine/threonine-protein kinase
VDTEQQKCWRAADAALDDLLDLPPAQRAASLAALPAEVRLLAARLLQAHGGHGPLDRTLIPAALVDGVHELQQSTAAGTQIGPWTVGPELGRGGMAVVYRASRAVASGEQHAALKLLTIAALAGDGRRRFLREHQVLARLSHPHIAALLDADVLPDGTPYLAMQLVEGERIDAWCSRHGAGPRDVVRLFLKVCDAVAHAHRQLVVHRDLKPANVLVDDAGEPRLLDFGIAGFTDAGLHGDTTRTALLALTPQYAAPEQFSGDDIGTAADVFGLGATLYHLLTGTPPRRHAQDATVPITLPSRAAAALSDARRQDFCPALRGDLDAILLKALEHDPRQRYADVTALSDDLRNWLAQRPVRAARGNRMYRMRKFVGRHRGSVAAAALLALVVAIGVIGTVSQAQRARAEADRALAVKEFVLELFRESTPDRARGADPPASELLSRGAQRVRGELATRPALLAEMLQVIGGVQLERGLIDDARESLDTALALLQGDDPADVQVRARIDRAMLDYELGRPSAAVQRLESASLLAAARLDPQHALHNVIDIRLADMLVVVGRADDATRFAAAARSRIERAGKAAVDPEYPYALRVLGAARQVAGDPAAAVPLLRAALDAQHVLDGDGSSRAAIENDLAISLIELGDHAGAEAALLDAFGIQRQLLGDAHPATIATASNLASVWLALGRNEQAAAAFESQIALLRGSHAQAPHPDFAHALGMAALAWYRSGAPLRAEPHAQEAVDIADQLTEADALTVAWTRGVLAALRMERGDDDVAALLERSGVDCRRTGVGGFLPLRICVAKAWLAAVAGECALPETPVNEAEATGDRLWLAAYWQLRAHCSGDAQVRESAAQRAAVMLADDQWPAWMLQALRAKPPGA